jgi:hypothetical protein
MLRYWSSHEWSNVSDLQQKKGQMFQKHNRGETEKSESLCTMQFHTYCVPLLGILLDREIELDLFFIIH